MSAKCLKNSENNSRGIIFVIISCQRAASRGSFVLTVGGFLLTVKLLFLQSLEALIRCTFPL